MSSGAGLAAVGTAHNSKQTGQNSRAAHLGRESKLVSKHRHCAHIGAPPCLATGDGVTEASPRLAAGFLQLTPVQGKACTCE
eukprot:scaffold98333_cov57-Phaeocystis_antarctica.AAC.1